jgi:predicted PurR-regulated permease PerM
MTTEPAPVSWWRRFAKLWGFALFFVLVAVVFNQVIMPFVFALAIAYILAPWVNRLSSLRVGKRHMPRGLAVLICYLAVVAVCAIFVVAFLPRISDDFARLGREAPGIWDRAQSEWTPKIARWLEKHFPSLAGAQAEIPTHDPKTGPLTELPPPPGTVLTMTPLANGDYAIVLPASGLELERVDDKHTVLRAQQSKRSARLETILRDKLGQVLEGLEGQVTEIVKFGQALVAGIIWFITMATVVLLLAAYILIDLEKLHEFARTLVPPAYRGDYDVILSSIDRGLNGVIRGQILVCLIDGVLTYIGLLIFDVKYSLLLAALAGVVAIIPIFGIILSAIPIFLVATISGDTIQFGPGLIMIAWIAGVHFVDANFVSPRIIGRQAKIHPVLVVFALYAGAESYGLVGALIAVPVASIVQTFFVFFRNRARVPTIPPMPPPPALPPPSTT